MKGANQDYLDNTLERECISNQYKSEFGGYRPHFEGSNPNILPNTVCTYVTVFLLLIPAWVISTGLFVGAVIWGTRANASFTYVCLGIIIATLILIIFTSYIGSYNRRTKESAYINSKEIELGKIKVLIKKEHEEADNLLLTAK